jgi:hypothetical protein
MASKTITIGEQTVTFKATAATPAKYRNKFKRDIIKDLAALSEKAQNVEDEAATFEALDLETFENIAYIMAQGDKPDDPLDWLDQFEMFSIMEILPELVALWGANSATLVEDASPKK